MNQTTLQARAQQRAHMEHVHIFSVPGRAGSYITKSKSSPTERYSLVAGYNGEVGCSCKGFGYRGSCKHAEALKNRLAREAARKGVA
jgi:hypothetical protein